MYFFLDSAFSNVSVVWEVIEWEMFGADHLEKCFWGVRLASC